MKSCRVLTSLSQTSILVMTSLDSKELEKVQEELKWIRLKYPDGEKQNVESRLLRNPCVPIGAAATLTALGLGILNFYKHDSLKQQLMMRCRIAAQGFTVIAVMALFGDGTVLTLAMKPKNM